MSQETSLSLKQIANLSRLAAGILPADQRDGGAAAVHAGPTIAARMRYSAYPQLYIDGLIAADRLASDTFQCGLAELSDTQLYELLGLLRANVPDFFRQLRADVCVLYLSHPGVWQRIGFPGESAQQGGYPDFDQPQ